MIEAMLIQVDRPYVESLIAHLSAQGFRASRVGEDGVEVLFPASPPLLTAAAELDDWLARTGATMTVGSGVVREPAHAAA